MSTKHKKTKRVAKGHAGQGTGDRLQAPAAAVPPASPARDERTFTRGKLSSQAAWPGALEAFGRALMRSAQSPQPVLAVILASFGLGLLYSSLELNAVNVVRVMGIAIALNLFLVPALLRYCLAIADGRHVTMAGFLRLDGERHATVLLSLGVAGFAVAVSLALLVVPVIWVLPWVVLTAFIATDRQVNPLEALRASRRLTRGHKLHVWGIVATTIALLALVQVIALTSPSAALFSNALGTMVAITSGSTMAMLYRWLEHTEGR